MNVHRIVQVIALLTVAGLLAAACAAPSAAPPQPAATPEPAPATAEGTPYKIGFCASITGSGSSLGIPERNTAEMLAAQYAGGLTGPDGVHHALQVIIYDTESNPDTAASVASRLITQDQVDVLVCGTLSGNSMAMLPIATENEVHEELARMAASYNRSAEEMEEQMARQGLMSSLRASIRERKTIGELRHLVTITDAIPGSNVPGSDSADGDKTDEGGDA